MLFIKSLVAIAVKDLVAKRTRFILTLTGIVAGVGCLLFLLALTLGINQQLRGELVGTIPVTELSALPKEEVKGGVVRDVSNLNMNDALLDEVKAIPGVKTVYGIQTLSAIPTTIKGWIFGGLQYFTTDTVVFGIPPELVRGDLKKPEKYKYDPNLKIQKISVPPGTKRKERYKIYKNFLKKYSREHGAVPVIVSKFLIETYNLSYAGTGRGMSKLSEEGFIGQKLLLQFESSDYLNYESSERIGLVCKVVGFSTRAPIMGVAVPPEYVNEWQDYCSGEETEVAYRKFVIVAETPSQVDSVIAKLDNLGFTVSTSKETIDKINTATSYIGLGFAMVGLLILFISSTSIVNVLTLSVNEEAVEIGILRSVGARKSQIRIIYLLKAAFIGIIGGLDGILLGLIAIKAGDKLALYFLRNAPYLPDTFFNVTITLVAGCFALGFIFSVIAGIFPANRAASLNPASVLRQG